MKLTVLGSCSGTEPEIGRHHCAFTIEHDGRLFWFDAGETCSYTAHTLGMDLSLVEAVFISHTHMDHIGGLPNLLWTMRKLTNVSEPARAALKDRTIRIHIPRTEVLESIMAILANTEGDFKTVFKVKPVQVEDGCVYEDHGIKVTACHNGHLGVPQDDEPWRSFSYRIEAGDKAIVFSGDVKQTEDCAPLLEAGCDVFLMETGHHKVPDVCSYLLDNRVAFGRLGFVHHGRAVLKSPKKELTAAQALLGDRVFIADDGMEYTL